MKIPNKNHRLTAFAICIIIAFFMSINIQKCEGSNPTTLYELVDMPNKGYYNNPLIIQASKATGFAINGSYVSNVAFYNYLVDNSTKVVEKEEIEPIQLNEFDSLAKVYIQNKLELLNQIDSLYLDTVLIKDSVSIVEPKIDTLVSKGRFYYLNGKKYKLKELPKHIVLPDPINWKGRKKRNTVLIKKVDNSNSHIGSKRRRKHKYSSPPSYKKKNKTTRKGKNCGTPKIFRWLENIIVGRPNKK